MKLKTLLSLLSVGLWVLFASGCIQFRTLSLYDGQAVDPPAPKPESIEQYVASTLFSDDTLNIWGIVEDSCKNFALTDEAYKGKKALKLKWNREGCKWVGFGLGWDDYSGKNLDPLISHAAFEMYVRTVEGRTFGLPMVFTLEDYSGGMSFAYTGNRYFETYYIDEKWQKVQVPLSAFDDEGEGIDYTNIKQLQIEMQQSGDVMVDEIRLVMYEPPVETPWVETPEAPDATALPKPLFDDAAVGNHGWGFMEDGCQSVVVTDEEVYEGEKAIMAKWSTSETKPCSLMVFGINWSDWNPVDVTKMKEQAELHFYIKAADPTALDFRIELEDFNRASSGVDWSTSYAKQAKDGWWAVNIPMAKLVENIDMKQVKSLQFRMQGEGEMYLDELRWE